MSESAGALPDRRMTVEEFLDWYDRQPEGGRYELLDGKVYVKRRPANERLEPSLAAERILHLRAKRVLVNVLQEAIERARLPCEAFTDGGRVRIDDRTTFEPDATVDCSEFIDPQAYVLPHPIIVVEVLSPGSRYIDTGLKLVRYFENPTILHYLVVNTESRAVIHYERVDEGITIRLLRGGPLDLSPPGLKIDLDEVWDRIGR